MVLATPELIKTQAVEMGSKIKVTLELQGGVLADWVMGGQEGSKLQTFGPATRGAGRGGLRIHRIAHGGNSTSGADRLTTRSVKSPTTRTSGG